MLILMRILHHQARFIPDDDERVHALILHRLVVLADQYLCIPSIRVQACSWLYDLRLQYHQPGKETSLLTSYILGDAEQFNYISKSLVMLNREAVF